MDKVWKKIYCHFYFREFTLRTPQVLPVGKWIHVAASYDHGSGRNSLYINGHLRASDNIGRGYKITTNTERVRMGRRNFKGKIAEMKVYDVALNEAQIQTSIRQGSCTFPVIVFSLPYPMFALVIKIPVTEQPRKIKQISVSGSCFVKQRRDLWLYYGKKVIDLKINVSRYGLVNEHQR